MDKSDEFKRISLSIVAHGMELANLKQYLYFDKENIAIFNCIGNCGENTPGNNKIIKQFYHDIDTEITKGDLNTFSTMERVSDRQKINYGNEIKNYNAILFAPKSLTRAKDIINKGEHCKIYHPQHDKIYKVYPSFFEQFFVDASLFGVTIKDIQGHPELKSLVSKSLLSPDAVDALRKSPLYTPSDENEIQRILLNFQNKTIRLSDITFLCKMLNFEYVNLYEFSCRTVNITDEKTLSDINVTESNTSARKSKMVGGKTKKTKKTKKWRQKQTKKLKNKPYVIIKS